MAGPLQGVRVLDIATLMAGPYAATMLADMGADVIKVESLAGDDARYVGDTSGGESAIFTWVNRNKRGISLDITSEAGYAALLDMVSQADVVLDNIRPEVKARLRITYDDLSAVNPSIVMVSVSAFGQDGPYAARPGTDIVAQAMAGFMGVNGEYGGGPIKGGVPVADASCAVIAAVGMLGALFHRERTGEGQHVQVCLLDAMLYMQMPMLASYFLTGKQPLRMGNQNPFICPSDAYECGDGRLVVVTVFKNKFFRNFARALGAPELATDERFSSNDERVKHRDELNAILRPLLRQRPAAEWIELFAEHDVLAGTVNLYDDVVADSQVRHNEMVVSTEHPTLGRISMPGVPIKLSATPGAVVRPGPTLGQHNDEVLTEYGFSPERLAALRAAEAIR